jgi:hypothetical protein
LRMKRLGHLRLLLFIIDKCNCWAPRERAAGE